MSAKDGGAAFPRPCGEYRASRTDAGYNLPSNGMTLRDWFAGQALQHIPELLEKQGLNLSLANVAEHAYGMADAMLKEREVDTAAGS